MYLGTKTETVPAYSNRYIAGIGTIGSQRIGVIDRTLESYKCETCGHVANVLGRATEPFYCRCGTLVGIDPA